MFEHQNLYMVRRSVHIYEIGLYAWYIISFRIDGW
jgi:hypothetical protein